MCLAERQEAQSPAQIATRREAQALGSAGIAGQAHPHLRRAYQRQQQPRQPICFDQTPLLVLVYKLVYEPRQQAGQSLAVFGVGGVGMSAVMAARLAGASRILAIDRNVARLDLAIELGATHAVVAGDDAVARIRAIVPRGVDLSLNTTWAAPCSIRPSNAWPLRASPPS